MDSPLNYVGGKSQSCKKIVELMPEHDCYCEVFCGGCWIFFAKPEAKIEVINDINSELINFYRVVQRKCDEFKKREKYEMYSRELYYEYMNDFYSGKHSTLDDVERAFRFFCLLKEAFGSTFGGGWGYGAVRNNATAYFNEFKIIDEISNRLKRVQIDNRDFEDVIKGYDNERTLFVTDPPYIKSLSENSNYYKSSGNVFTMFDHQRLFNRLKTIKGKVILTIDDMPWIRERYTKENGFYIIENEVFYCSAPKDNRTHEIELIITNYDVSKIDKHIDIRQGKLEF